MEYKTFADDVHALILERGLSYYKAGAVQNLERTPDGWGAEVDGQQTYSVVITGVQKPLEWYCNCPHDHGPVCKHIAAVLFAINDQLADTDEEE